MKREFLWLLMLALMVRPAIGTAALVYELSSPTDPTTYGSVTVNASIGDTYNAINLWSNWNLTVFGIALTPGNSVVNGGVGAFSLLATATDPFGDATKTVAFSRTSGPAWPFSTFLVARNAVANSNCVGTPSGCVSSFGGTLLGNVRWRLRAVIAVPEPGTVVLVGLGLLGIVLAKATTLRVAFKRQSKSA